MLGVKFSRGQFHVTTRFLEEWAEKSPEVIKAYDSAEFLVFDAGARKPVLANTLGVNDAFQVSPGDSYAYQVNYIEFGKNILNFKAKSLSGTKTSKVRVEPDAVVNRISLLTETPDGLSRISEIQVGQEINVIAAFP